MSGINDYIKIGKRIKQVRKQNKIQQKEMAHILGISQSAYSNYENENREPSFKVILQFCEHFGMSIDDILSMELYE